MINSKYLMDNKKLEMDAFQAFYYLSYAILVIGL